jgi:hypothetical protein
MQRIGRVNRIGSTADEVHVFNFYPTAKVNNDIELEKKAIMKLQSFHAALGEDSQIYSPDEETETFGLFDHLPVDESDEKLAYLMMIRDIKEKTPGIFKQIKNMPLRARVGRRKTQLDNSTICYIKDSKRDAFILVKENEETEELTFLETVKIFEADVLEKSIALHSITTIKCSQVFCFSQTYSKRKRPRIKKLIRLKDLTRKEQMLIWMPCLIYLW